MMRSEHPYRWSSSRLDLAKVRRAGLVGVMLGFMLYCPCMSSLAVAWVADSSLAGVASSGGGYSTAKHGNKLFVGGHFSSAADLSGSGVPFTLPTGLPLERFPRVAGDIFAVESDRRGGWWIAGNFSLVGGSIRRGIAHILPDGRVEERTPLLDGEARALFVTDSVVYCGGSFRHANGQTRERVLALSARTGELLPWSSNVGGAVFAIASQGDTVFVAGQFSDLGGQPRSNLGAISGSDGRPLDWRCDVSDRVRALVVREGTLYVGGYFATVGGHPRRCFAAVNAQDGTVQPLDLGLDRQPPSTRDGGPHVNAILEYEDTLVIGGTFTHVRGFRRSALAQFDLRTQLLTGWAPNPGRAVQLGAEVLAIAKARDNIMVAGAIDSIAGVPCGYACMVGRYNGEPTAWDPKVNGFVWAAAATDTTLYLGGTLNSLERGAGHLGIAAVDLSSGRLLPWDPHVDSGVLSLMTRGDRLFVGGGFTRFGQAARSGLASFRLPSMELEDWAPGADWEVWCLGSRGDVIYAGGPLISFIGGKTRRGIAALDANTGKATDWNPNVLTDVYTMMVTDSCVFIGGDFFEAGGQPRGNLAALDFATGAALAWSPPVVGAVLSMARLDTTIFIGGLFSSVGGLPRRNFAAIGASGAVLPLIADTDQRVYALAVRDSAVLMGGLFSTVGGVSSEWYGELDLRTGLPRAGLLGASGQVRSIWVDAETTFIAGDFDRFERALSGGFAVVRPDPLVPPPPPPPPPLPTHLSLASCLPNPAIAATTVRYALPQRGPVSLALYDLSGRLVTQALDRVEQAAGSHQHEIRTDRLRAGCYFVSLMAGGQRATSKVVVVN